MALLDVLKVPEMNVTDPNFYVLLDSHVAYLTRHPLSEWAQVTGQQAEKYRGDFHGLLDSLSIDKKYHYLITRMNGLVSSGDYDGFVTQILLPDYPTAARFMAIWTTRED